MSVLKQRSEILFLYDVSWGNPNGDPVDENKPRIDEETSRNIVTDVRLKRTVRDFLYHHKGQEIFIREISDEKDYIQDAKTRAEDFLKKDGRLVKKTDVKSLAEMKQIIKDNILSSCIDVRLFGGTLPVEKSSSEKSSITYTGPVQFKMGSSMHRVKMEYLKGTGAFASGKDQTRKTFREEYVLPYSLISFYGIVNEQAAKSTHLTEDDVQLLLEAMWVGTKNLISRSKMNHVPRLLLRVIYNEPYFHIGELDKRLNLQFKKSDEELRDVSDFVIDLNELVKELDKYRVRIDRIECAIDERLQSNISLVDELKQRGFIVDVKVW